MRELLKEVSFTMFQKWYVMSTPQRKKELEEFGIGCESIEAMQFVPLSNFSNFENFNLNILKQIANKKVVSQMSSLREDTSEKICTLVSTGYCTLVEHLAERY